MHCGNIDNPKNAAARVYAVLKSMNGNPVEGWELMGLARTRVVGTRASEINQQLRHRGINERIECERKGHYFYYRLVSAGQMELNLAFAVLRPACGEPPV